MNRSIRTDPNPTQVWPVFGSSLDIDPFDVLAGSSVDLDDIPCLNEPRNNELGPRFHLRWLGHVGGGVPLGPRGTVDNFQMDVRRRFDHDRLAVEQRDCARHPIFEKLPQVSPLLATDLVLLEGLAIHKHIALPLAVEKSGLDCLDIRRFERVSSLIGPIEHRPADKIFEATFVHRVSFPGLDEIHFRHEIRLAINLHFQSFAKVAGVVSCHGKTAPNYLDETNFGR